MALIGRAGQEWVFRHGKHEGETLEDVAADDPGYLVWVFQEVSLDEDSLDALEDVLEEFGIEA